GPMIGVVPKFSRTPGGVAATGPSLGEHTREVLPGPSFEGGAGVSTDTGDASTTKRLYSRPSDAELIAQIFDKTDLKEQSHATPQLRELGQTRAGWTIGSQFVFSQHLPPGTSQGHRRRLALTSG